MEANTVDTRKDHLTPEERSLLMGKIRGKNTKPEVVVRKTLYKLGYRFRLHRKDLPGSPDIVFPGRKKVIFVHGCFWHRHEGCRAAGSPKSRIEFWEEKFARNTVRDNANLSKLSDLGWKTLVLWTCELKPNSDFDAKLRAFLDD